MDEARRCKAKSKRSGSRCKKAALKGGKVCRTHGGVAPQTKAAAKRRQEEEAALAVASRMVARAGISSDPIAHLLDSLHLAAALVDVWGTMVAAIDDNAEDEAAAAERLRGELDYYEDTEDESPYKLRVYSKDRMLTLNRHGEASVHPYVLRYEASIERRAKFAKLCIDAGIAERQVRIAERQGQLIAQAITAIFKELGIDLTPKILDVIGRRLRSLSDGHGDPALN